MEPSSRILLIGKGGREHALAWGLSKSASVEHIFVVPGNGGTAQGVAKVFNLDAPAKDYSGLVSLAKEKNVGLVVVGPDDEVVDGIEGYFTESKTQCFAPSKEACVIEGSKAWAKDFMNRRDIPTAQYQTFDDYKTAKSFLGSVDYRAVIKASGLAAGKGVKLPTSQDEAQANLKSIMLDGEFGSAGDSVVIEECLEGEEISLLILSDGITTKTFPAAQDHKRAYDGDRGPNTGGMGAYAPTPLLNPELMNEIQATIVAPTLAGLKAEGRTFKGLLFIGLMLTASGPKVLEFNARFGDPETQSIIPLLTEDTDLAALLLACTNGTLEQVPMAIRPKFACNVVVTAGGYPGDYATGDDIEIGQMPEDVFVFHAGTKWVDGKLKTAGGRVLAITALRDTLEDAVDAAYEGVKAVKFRNMFYRKDIAQRALQRNPGVQEDA